MKFRIYTKHGYVYTINDDSDFKNHEEMIKKIKNTGGVFLPWGSSEKHWVSEHQIDYISHKVS